MCIYAQQFLSYAWAKRRGVGTIKLFTFDFSNMRKFCKNLGVASVHVLHFAYPITTIPTWTGYWSFSCRSNSWKWLKMKAMEAVKAWKLPGVHPIPCQQLRWLHLSSAIVYEFHAFFSGSLDLGILSKHSVEPLVGVDAPPIFPRPFQVAYSFHAYSVGTVVL